MFITIDNLMRISIAKSKDEVAVTYCSCFIPTSVQINSPRFSVLGTGSSTLPSESPRGIQKVGGDAVGVFILSAPSLSLQRAVGGSIVMRLPSYGSLPWYISPRALTTLSPPLMAPQPSGAQGSCVASFTSAQSALFIFFSIQSSSLCQDPD